jgi:4-diphosphocytidyl-2-C-methyl-D-erythritol kinase
MRVVCPAKINLHLRVGPIGSDGFHPLMSWMSTIGLADTIEMTAGDAGRIELSCDAPGLAVDGSNLILRAGRALAEESGDANGARVRLQKRIPVGGGLGGGSSDAAGALIGFNRLWNLHWPIDRLARIGASLGSDVPFFFHGPSSVCTGRGENVRPIRAAKPRFAVLVFPDLAMSTPAVYRQFDQMKLGSIGAIEEQPDWQRWTSLTALELLPLLVNDLEVPAFMLSPQLRELRQRIETTIGRIVRMSGSGSTLFTLADHRAEADEAAAAVSRAGVKCEVFELGPVFEA